VIKNFCDDGGIVTVRSENVDPAVAGGVADFGRIIAFSSGSVSGRRFPKDTPIRLELHYSNKTNSTFKALESDINSGSATI
jgi:hypothetical protein